MLAGRKFFWPIIGLGFLICLLIIAQFFFGVDQTFISPLVKGGFNKLMSKKTQVVGFLPFWNIKDDYSVKYSQIDELVYFGLMVGEDGSFIKYQDGGAEPGFNKLASGDVQGIFDEFKKRNKKILVSFISQDADITDKVISDPILRQHLVDEIINVVKVNNLDGVDIDFEYFPGDNNLPDFGNQFNQFLWQLKKELIKTKSSAILSVDIYSKAVIYDWPYNLKEMGTIVDQIIIMGYDFSQTSSFTAGPVAPMNGKDENDMSLVQTVNVAINEIPHEKLILGIPLYGYEWRTVSEEPRSPAYYNSGVLATYERVKKLIEEEKLEVKWDEAAFSPWLVYRDGWRINEIYFEDLKSLALKIELAQQLNFHGIAFWALGYEGQDQDIWDLLKKKL